MNFNYLLESMNDRYKFKAIFFAGGPGAGKSDIANLMFLFTKSLSPYGAKLLDPDTYFEKALKASKENKVKMDFKDDKIVDVYKNSINIRDKLWDRFEEESLPMVIAGTGRDANNVFNIARMLMKKGYDTYMVFVDTSLETCLKRNASRERSLTEKDVKRMHKEATNNITVFENFFGSYFNLVDNNADAITTELKTELERIGRRIITSPVYNKVGRDKLKSYDDLKKGKEYTSKELDIDF